VVEGLGFLERHVDLERISFGFLGGGPRMGEDSVRVDDLSTLNTWW